jgi:hypothetical protein
MILKDSIRKGEKNQRRISSGLGIPGEAGHRFQSKVQVRRSQILLQG